MKAAYRDAPSPERPRRPPGLSCIVALALGAAPAARAEAGPPALPGYPDHANLMVVRSSDGAESPVRSAADWQVRRAHVVEHLQQVMGRLPGGERRVPLDLRVLETIDEPGRAYVRKKVSYASEPGDRVPAWLLVPRAARKAPAMLCLHQTTAIGKDEPAGLGGNSNLHYGKELAERGFVALCPDYPNFGEHKVDPYALGYVSASMKAIWDNLRGVDLLGSLEQVDPGRIGVIGHSLGGHNAIFTAVFEPRLGAVVSSCGFNSFPYYYRGNIAGWSHKGYMPRLREVYGLDPGRVPFDFPELIGALAPRAFLSNSPTRDANFDVEGVRACMTAAASVYEMLGARDRLRVLYPDAAHDFPGPERNVAYDFLRDVLTATP